MKYFWKALDDYLTADATLVSLTGHTTPNPRIFKGYPETVAIYPVLVYYDKESTPAIPDSTPIFLWTKVCIVPIAKNELLVSDIQDRIKQLLDQKNIILKDAYMDISNADICNRMTNLLKIGKIERDEKTDSWSNEIEVEFHWNKL
jgi:hypothetical protein